MVKRMRANATRERVCGAASSVLKPLVRILLRCGVGYGDFADIAKEAYIEAACKDYPVRTKPANIAQVASITGLSRKEVSRLRGKAFNRKIKPVPYRNFPAEILHCWHTDPSFLDSSGGPKPLPFSGQRLSFSSLVRMVSPETHPRALLREMQRARAIANTAGGKLIALRREFVPASIDEKAIEGLQYGLRRLAETVCYNAEVENLKSSKFQRIVHTNRIRVSDVEIVRHSLAAVLASFATRIDDYLTSFHVKSSLSKADNELTCHVGVGLYYFDGSG